MKKLLLFAFAACALAACSDDDGDSRVPATAVVLDCTEKELAVGETLQLTATPAPANTTDDVVWSSDAEEFATVSESGLVTAVAAGTAKISATYGSVSATCTVHVSEPDPEPDPDPNPDPEPEPSNLISFETSEGMLAIDGKAVQLGDITVSGGSAAGNHHNVFWAKGGSYDDLAVGGVYNGYLCSTSDEKIWFGTYFSADIGYGDYWGGFVLSANYGRTATSVNYANQFMVWADKGANGSSNCMIGYFDGYTSGYATPMIEFVEPRQVSYLYMANSAITYPYKPTQVDEASYYYKVKITGSLEGKETGSAECFLINGSEKLSDWKKVDLSALANFGSDAGIMLNFHPRGFNFFIGADVPMCKYEPAYYAPISLAAVNVNMGINFTFGPKHKRKYKTVETQSL